MSRTIRSVRRIRIAAMRHVLGCTLACCLLAPHGSRAADAARPTTLPGVVVVGQRQLARTPASIDRVLVKDIPARPQASVSELLRRVPGVAAHDRQNLAQDVQLTI